MEKYSKFDDPSNGLNPFTPLDAKSANKTAVVKFLRSLLGFFLVAMRTPLFLIVLWVGSVLHTLKYIFGVSFVIRKIETWIDSLDG